MNTADFLELSSAMVPDRAAVRRWKSNEMRPGREEMDALHEKINADIERLWEVRRKSEIRKPDWR